MGRRWRFGAFELAVDERRLLADGRPVPLGGRAFDLLCVLAEHADRVVSKDELFARVWPGLVVEDNNLTVQVSALRRVLGTSAISSGEALMRLAKSGLRSGRAGCGPLRSARDASMRMPACADRNGMGCVAAALR